MSTDSDDSDAHDLKPAERLAGKVDALLGKHKAESTDRNIPVLTDLVDAPDWTPGQPHAPVPQTAPALVNDTAPIARPQEPLSSLSDEDIDQLSQDIFARVSQRIDAELATSLEARLNEHLQSQISGAVSHVLADMKMSIANEIGDAVNAALADRLRNTVRK
jgi:hypothetical protein